MSVRDVQREDAEPAEQAGSGQLVGDGHGASAEAILALQRTVGNAAVAAAFARERYLARQQVDAGTAAAAATFKSFNTSGKAHNGMDLGAGVNVGPYWTNSVEMVFALGGTAAGYTDLRLRQWSGPEAVWMRIGNPDAGMWIGRDVDEGSGDDSQKEARFIKIDATEARLVDTPGVPFNYIFKKLEGESGKIGRPTRVYQVANYTTWVEGKPRSGGSPRRITDQVFAWHTIVSLRDEKWSEDDPGRSDFRYARPETRAGTSWFSTDPPK